MGLWAFLLVQIVKNLPAMQETQIWSLGQQDPLEKGMATHSSILAGAFQGQRSVVGYSPWGRKELDTTEWLAFLLSDRFILSSNFFFQLRKELLRNLYQSWRRKGLSQRRIQPSHFCVLTTHSSTTQWSSRLLVNTDLTFRGATTW